MSFSLLTFSLADDSPCLNKDLHYIALHCIALHYITLCDRLLSSYGKGEAQPAKGPIYTSLASS